MTSNQLSQYEENGFTILPGLLTHAECEEAIGHMMALQACEKKLEGFGPREPDNWGRTHNQHLYDPMAMKLLLHPALREPLDQCYGGEAEGIQTMYFWKGSEQRRHQDQYYLPGCMSAWIALQDVSEANGTIYVQPGSHKKHLLTRADLTEKLGDEHDVVWGEAYNNGVDEIFEQNGGDEIPVEVSKGDVVLFHGILIHRGGPIKDKGSFRHVMANHYIPYAFDEWPHRTWPRFDFDGVKRLHPKPDAV